MSAWNSTADYVAASPIGRALRCCLPVTVGITEAADTAAWWASYPLHITFPEMALVHAGLKTVHCAAKRCKECLEHHAPDTE